jgi:hypothetical protein
VLLFAASCILSLLDFSSSTIHKFYKSGEKIKGLNYLWEFLKNALSDVNILDEDFVVFHSSCYREIDSHFSLDLGNDALQESVNEGDYTSFLVEVWVFIDVFQAFQENNDGYLDLFQLFSLFYLRNWFLYNLHVLVVPFGFFSTLYDSAFLLSEFLNTFIFTMCRPDLDTNLHIALLNFHINRFQNPAHISPVVNFTNHSLTWNCIPQLF